MAALWCMSEECISAKESFGSQQALNLHASIFHKHESPSARAAAFPIPHTEQDQGGDDDDVTGTWISFTHSGGPSGTSVDISIEQDYMTGLFGFSGHVCDSSKRLSRCLLSHMFPKEYFKGKKCLELGAGCGLVSMVLAQCGAHVTVTDMEPSLAHLNEQLQSNLTDMQMEKQIRLLALDWTDQEQVTRALRDPNGDTIKYDFICASDCIYQEEMVELLLTTMATLASNSTLIVYTGLPLNAGGRPQHETLVCLWIERVQRNFQAVLGTENNLVDDCGQALYTHGIWLLHKRSIKAAEAEAISELQVTPHVTFH